MSILKVRKELPCVVLIRDYAKSVTHNTGFALLGKTIVVFCKKHQIELLERVDGRVVDTDDAHQQYRFLEDILFDLFYGIETFDKISAGEIIDIDDEGVRNCCELVEKLGEFSLSRELLMLSLDDLKASLLAKTEMPAIMSVVLRSLIVFNENN